MSAPHLHLVTEKRCGYCGEKMPDPTCNLCATCVDVYYLLPFVPGGSWHDEERAKIAAAGRGCAHCRGETAAGADLCDGCEPYRDVLAPATVDESPWFDLRDCDV